MPAAAAYSAQLLPQAAVLYAAKFAVLTLPEKMRSWSKQPTSWAAAVARRAASAVIMKALGIRC
jgi:hypothetical protein